MCNAYQNELLPGVRPVERQFGLPRDKEDLALIVRGTQGLQNTIRIMFSLEFQVFCDVNSVYGIF